MVKALELARQMLFGTALALLVASTFLIPQHQALGDDRGGGDISLPPAKCAGDVCSVNCLGCIVGGPGGGTYCDSGIQNVPCRCNKDIQPPPGKSCAPCSCEAVWVDEERPELGKRCSCK